MPEPLRLNRTFYGIETVAIIAATWCLLVLIVPFMELKLGIAQRLFQYGYVLIVPFMELKL